MGTVDENIGKGIPVDEAVRDILKAIYLKRFWVTIGSFYYYISPKILSLSENLTTFANKKLYKKQVRVMNEAKAKKE